jgi:hypothetical protein
MAKRAMLGPWLLISVWLVGSAGCSKDQPSIPKQEEPPKPKTLSEQALTLWQRDIEEYQVDTRDPPSLRPQVEEFMRTVQLGMLPHPRGPGVAKTTEMGKRLLEQGSQDPLAMTYYARAVCSERGIFDVMNVILEALNVFGPRGYPRECSRVGLFALFGEAKKYSATLQWDLIRSETAKLAARRLGDETIAPEMRRVVWYELSTLIDDDCGRNWEDSVAIYDACKKQSKADPWILHLLAGRAYVARAWHHRGGDWAYKVTPEGWKLFAENLRKAAQEYTEAWKLHPENPEAASEMITVAMGDGSDQTPKAWFDKAVAAQIDYMPAYYKLRLALRPRWGGSYEEMYRLGCQCADTRRYDTQVPFALVYSIDNIDEELDYNGTAWQRKGVYERVKQVLEAMANDPSRADGSGLYPTKSSVMTIHAALAERAGQYADARRLVDALGDRFDRWIFDTWCGHPEFVLANIYVFSGKGAEDVKKAWQTLKESPKPCSDQALQRIRGFYQKALAADDNERSKTYCRCRLTELEGRLAYSAGKWFEKKFDPKLLCWAMASGTWSAENENSAVGRAHHGTARVQVRPVFSPVFPLEIEFDVEVLAPPRYPLTLGLFLPEAGQTGPGDHPYHQFFIRTIDNQAGIDICGQAKTVPCSLKPVNRLRVQLADGRAVLFVNDHLCLDRREKDFHPQPAFNLGCHNYLYPSTLIRVSNVRFRKWQPPKETSATDEPTRKKAAPIEKAPPAKHGETKKK